MYIGIVRISYRIYTFFVATNQGIMYKNNKIKVLYEVMLFT